MVLVSLKNLKIISKEEKMIEFFKVNKSNLNLNYCFFDRNKNFIEWKATVTDVYIMISMVY